MKTLQCKFFPCSLVPRILGETIKVGLDRLKYSSGGPLSPYFASATVQVYLNSVSQFGPQRLNVDTTQGPGVLLVSWPLTTGAIGRNINAAGTYHICYTVLQSDGTVTVFEQYLTIQPRP